MTSARRRIAAVCGLILGTLFATHRLAGQASGHPEVRPTPLPSFIEFDNLAVPMRDGVNLATDVYVPPGAGRWPAVLVRTPYNRRSHASQSYRVFTEHGYAIVIQDVRGRWESGGSFGSIKQEGPDGSDTINWIAKQPWSNGRVGMVGASYVGIVQWWAAVQHNPHLLAIFPLVSGDDEYTDRYYSTGGGLQLSHRLIWLSENLTPRGKAHPAYDSYIRHVPLMNADVAATTQKLQLWRVPLSHPSFDKFWLGLSIRSQLPEVTAAVSSVGGWFDTYCESDLDAFSHLAQRGVPVETWIGPWTHGFLSKYPDVDFGATASPHVRSLEFAWFDKFLKVPAREASSKPRLHIYVMGAGTWREEHEWPLARTKYVPFYLESNGHANGAAGDGRLDTTGGRDNSADHFAYDPANPVPTKGGAVCCNPTLSPAGPLDQTDIERRPDVLIYTSAPLTADTEVTGPIGVTLYVATSANDTDFSAKLVDVDASGIARLVTDGLTRLRYRLSLTKPVFVKHDTPYQVHIDAGVTSWIFLEGHRIRLEISSSNFPKYDRNLNVSRPIANESKWNIARQTVVHDKRYPSVLVLPVIPRLRTSSPVVHSHSRVQSFAVGAH